MNEQTKIELLKIATELSITLINKHPSYPGANKSDSYTPFNIFNDCVKAVHEQYQALTEDIALK